MPSLQSHAKASTPVDSVEERVEHICEQGCRVVRKTIDDFDHGQQITDLNNLSTAERDRVMAELKDIMAVYEKNGSNGCDS
jgi:4-hydroxy-3-methylbut-2-en-1-yl diphosphate synthase IspG/GcpE